MSTSAYEETLQNARYTLLIFNAKASFSFINSVFIKTNLIKLKKNCQSPRVRSDQVNTPASAFNIPDTQSLPLSHLLTHSLSQTHTHTHSLTKPVYIYVYNIIIMVAASGVRSDIYIDTYCRRGRPFFISNEINNNNLMGFEQQWREVY